jgi:hypothetical protein
VRGDADAEAIGKPLEAFDDSNIREGTTLGTYPESLACPTPQDPGTDHIEIKDEVRTVSFPISSSVIANSTACRHRAMWPLLVRSTATEESTS